MAAKGWWRAHAWLIARRASQLGILALFLSGPVTGVWVVEGTLASSLTLDVLPLTDPLVLAQSLVAGHVPAATAMIGAVIVLAVYAALAGRMYCAWVCPINMVTDLASWLRARLGVGARWRPSRSLRHWMLLATLVGSGLATTVLWELINPITMLMRALLFGAGSAVAVVLAVFAFDLLVSRVGWCAALCPVGAFYGLVGSQCLVRVRADLRDRCNDCMDCYAVCPESQVIKPALKGSVDESRVIASGNCTNCARCIDVCDQDVYCLATRFFNKSDTQVMQRTEITP